MPFDESTFDAAFDFVGGTSGPVPLPPEVAPGLVFDPQVFDVGVFDALYSVPFMQKCVIGRGYRRLVAGSSIPITLYIQQDDSTPGRLHSLNPEGVEVQIYYPDGSVRRGYSSMTNMRTGVYTYRHSTLNYDPKGCYSGNFKMTHGDKTTITESQLFFEVV